VWSLCAVGTDSAAAARVEQIQTTRNGNKYCGDVLATPVGRDAARGRMCVMPWGAWGVMVVYDGMCWRIGEGRGRRYLRGHIHCNSCLQSDPRRAGSPWRMAER